MSDMEVDMILRLQLANALMFVPSASSSSWEPVGPAWAVRPRRVWF
ncbi:hypothetical protein [Streptomyces sp. NPDC051684]